jgi:hypothetical protein
MAFVPPTARPFIPQPPPQMGGVRNTVLDEIQLMSGYFVLIGLVLLSVYVSRVPKSTLHLFSKPLFQVLGLTAVVLITSVYGWVHGILAALAFALLVSRSLRRVGEGMADYVSIEPSVMVIEDSNSVVVPENHLWFLEKVMGETPMLIREKEVKTSAIQDFSEKSMGASSVTR